MTCDYAVVLSVSVMMFVFHM